MSVGTWWSGVTKWTLWGGLSRQEIGDSKLKNSRPGEFKRGVVERTMSIFCCNFYNINNLQHASGNRESVVKNTYKLSKNIIDFFAYVC